MRFSSGLLLAVLLAVAPASGEVRRVVMIKVDGLPPGLIEQYTRPSGQPERTRLPRIAEIFNRNGAIVENFYVRGLSLSAPSWSLLDTGRHLRIHGNVEYDRYTLRPWDYLNFFPFYVGYALSRDVDMRAVQLLDRQGVPLLIDRFPYDQRYQSFQLLQRGVRWSTLEASLKHEFAARSLKDLFDEWQTGFSMADSINLATERDVMRDLKNPKIRYLDYFTGEYDHVAHLTPDGVSQLHVLESLDALTGRIWDAIQASPLADTTLLVLVSDHGMNTEEHVYSQGYNLVDWFRGAGGGGHHVITDRYPLTEFKLKGLDPFVSEVITPSSEAGYLNGKSAEYPTVVLDLDGNERANIALRDNALNQVQILLDQLLQKRVSGAMRVAVIASLFDRLDQYRPAWEEHLQHLEASLRTLRERVAEQQKLVDGSRKKWSKAERDQGLDKDARRAGELLSQWKDEERADSSYLATMRRLLSLTAADFDPGKFKIEDMIPRKSLGRLNSIHDLRNYVVGLGQAGLVLDSDGRLDLDLSFKRIDYFSALTAIAVRNNLQKDVGTLPVDFIAVRVEAQLLRAAMGDVTLEDGIWLYGAPDRQALVITRRDGSGNLELRYLPVANLRQAANGALTFDHCEWMAGLPLGLWEDEGVIINGDRAQWLSEWHDEHSWLRAIHRSRYSNGLIGLMEQLLEMEPPRSGEPDRLRTDLLVFAANHWNFNVRGFNPGGNHGSLLRASAHSVLMFAGGKGTGLQPGLRIDTPYDSLSLVPTILALMGKSEPNLPGPVIRELLPQ